MSNIFKMAAMLLLCTFSLPLQSQSISAADQKGIEATYHAFMTAFDQMDAAALGPLFTENAEVISPMGEITRGHDNVVAMHAQMFKYFSSLPKPDKFERKNLSWQSRYLANDLVLVTYTEETTSYFGEKKNVEKLSQSVVLHKINDKWMAELVSLTPVVDMRNTNN